MRTRLLVAVGVWLISVSCEKGTDSPSQNVKRAPTSTFDVGAVIQRVHFAWRPDANGFTSAHNTHSARFDTEGLELTPFHFRNSSPNFRDTIEGVPVRFGAAQVSRG